MKLVQRIEIAHLINEMADVEKRLRERGVELNVQAFNIMELEWPTWVDGSWTTIYKGARFFMKLDGSNWAGRAEIAGHVVARIKHPTPQFVEKHLRHVTEEIIEEMKGSNL